MRYVLLFFEDEHPTNAVDDQAARDRAVMEVMTWFERHGDHVRANARLQPSDTATTVRIRPGSKPLVMDGPFIEGKDLVTGFIEIEADDFDHVLTMASKWPGCPRIEIRPVLWQR